MNQIIGISAAVIATALCCVVLRKQTPELSTVLSITGGVLIIAALFPTLRSVIGFLSDLSEQAGLSKAILAPVLKVTGISIVTKTAGDICRDAQESGLAAFLEIGGVILALASTVPLAQAVLNTISNLI